MTENRVRDKAKAILGLKDTAMASAGAGQLMLLEEKRWWRDC